MNKRIPLHVQLGWALDGGISKGDAETSSCTADK